MKYLRIHLIIWCLLCIAYTLFEIAVFLAFNIISFIWQFKQSPWISVNERLPENEDMVFTLCKVKRSNNYFICVNNYIDGEWEAKALVYYDTVYYDTVAWMPIPSFDDILEANRDVLERIKEKGD